MYNVHVFWVVTDVRAYAEPTYEGCWLQVGRAGRV